MTVQISQPHGIRIKLSSSPGQTISKRVPWSSIGGLIWGKPNFFANPKVCKYAAGDMPSPSIGFDALYNSVAGTMTGGAVTDYATWGWTSPTPKACLDIVVRQWLPSFSAKPTNVAIALNFDDTLTTASPYYYDFATEVATQVDPTQLISESDNAGDLGFIQDDPFTSGKVTEHYTTGGDIVRRKTLIFVCPVVSGGGESYVPYSVRYLEALMAAADTGNAQYFDPKIRNDG